jgi:hypothetical protein
MKGRRRLVAVASALFILIGLDVMSAPAVLAATPTFTVMNTSESLPDGVYFRNSAHTNDTSRIAGLGVYKNERVQLRCYAWGDAVGRYNDKLWYYAKNVTRPTVGSRANVGYLNAHYINDGQNANVVDAGVVRCGSAPPPTPTPVAGYYSPFNPGVRGDDGKIEDLRDQIGIYTSNIGIWYACSAVNDTPYFALHGQLKPGQFYDRVGGWSLGRLGPAYLIQGMREYDPNQLRKLNYIILIDPGNYAQLNPCDVRNGSGNLYAAWLKYNTNARLVVLSGKKTQENSSKGIQEVYFNAIRQQAPGTNIRSRVLVCNYNADHYQIYHAGQYWIKHVIGANSCPTLNYDGTYWSPTAWRP